MNLLCGNVASLGNKVAFNVRRNKIASLTIGIVIGFSEKMVRVEYTDRYTGKTITSSFMPHNMVRVYEKV